VAYGTERGVPIPIRDHNGELQGHKRDRSGETVLSRVSPKALEAVANSGGGLFAFSTMDDSEMEAIFKNSLSQQRSNKSQVQTRLYQEYFWLPLALALFFLLLAYSPTIGWGRTAGTLVLLLALAPVARAEDPVPTPAAIKMPWYSIFWNQEKESIQAAKRWIDAKQPSQASRVLLDEQARNSDSPNLDYNVATALANEGRRPEAERALADPKLLGNPDLKPYALFNQGGLAAKDKDKGVATRALYDSIQALEGKAALTDENRALLTQARKNLELLLDPEKQPQNSDDKKDPKQEDRPKDNPEQKKDDSGDPKENQDQQDRDAKDKKNESQKYENKKQRFTEREDLSEKDAKQILESLKNQESSLQKKLLKDQFGKEKGEATRDDKDW
jgi:hypothetical protein